MYERKNEKKRKEKKEKEKEKEKEKARYLVFSDGMQLLLRRLGIRVIGAVHVIVLRGQT